ncbi:MAG: hypothetical protein F6K56_35400 [Moorea sp. SIO3G5]|nr:hypothetical protein [Moorena sp. SIO3G5]
MPLASCLLPLASCLSLREYVHNSNKNSILLFPVPCSLFPIPYSLLPTPYSLLPNDNQYGAISAQQEYP